VLPKIGEPFYLRVENSAYLIERNMERYKVFRKFPYCNACGIKLERIELCIEPDNINKEYRKPYLRFYSHSGVMFTIDHIMPKNEGGTNDFSNLQSMCVKCNRKKGHNPDWKYIINSGVLSYRVANGHYINIKKLRDFQYRKVKLALENKTVYPSCELRTK